MDSTQVSTSGAARNRTGLSCLKTYLKWKHNRQKVQQLAHNEVGVDMNIQKHLESYMDGKGLHKYSWLGSAESQGLSVLRFDPWPQRVFLGAALMGQGGLVPSGRLKQIVFLKMAIRRRIGRG